MDDVEVAQRFYGETLGLEVEMTVRASRSIISSGSPRQPPTSAVRMISYCALRCTASRGRSAAVPPGRYALSDVLNAWVARSHVASV